MEEDFITWKDRFWPAVCEHFGFEMSGEDFSLRQYKVTIHGANDISPAKIFTGETARLNSYIKQKPYVFIRLTYTVCVGAFLNIVTGYPYFRPFDGKNPYLSKVLVNRELHKGGDRSCMHIEFNIKDARIRYGPP